MRHAQPALRGAVRRLGALLALARHGMVLLLLLSLSACGRDVPRVREDVPRHAALPDTSAVRRLAALDSGLGAIENGLRTAPRDRWDPKSIVERIGKDPAALTAWVRDSTAWIPYRGLLRGPVGVLMDRDGNSLDRGLLLANLLKLAGHEVRLARATLDREVAVARLPELVARRQLVNPASTLPPSHATSVSLTSASSGTGQDAVTRMLAAEERAAQGIHAELDRRVRDQAGRLLALTTAPDRRRDWARRRSAAIAALRDHWWVQRRDGDRWTDHDPLDAEATASETLAPDGVPEDLRHRIAVRVVAEEWSQGTLSEHQILQHMLHPTDLNGRAIVLQIWPGSWPAEVHPDPASPLGMRGIALEQDAWSVALTVDGQPAAEGRLADVGRYEETGAPGPLGGLGGAIRKFETARASTAGRRAKELTSAWIEYQLLAPDAPSRTIRRAIFDLVGPSARAKGGPDTLVLDEHQRLVRSLALMIRTEILPVTQRMAPQFAVHRMMERLVANRPMLEQLVAQPDGERPADSVLAAGTPALSALYSLAYVRTAWSPVADRVYVDRLGLLTQHRHPAILGNLIGMRGAFDVAMGDMGVSLAEPDAFSVRLRQGVFDTNAEGLWWSGVASLNTGELFGTSTSTEWTALTPAGRDRLAALAIPDDARFRIGQDLASGLMVVAPTAAIPVDHERFVGWWRIDPETGATRGVSGNGWGQCNAEYGVNLRTVAWAYARGFFFEFALCQAIAQSINGSRTIAAELQKRKLWFWWMPPIVASDPKSVFRDNAKVCLVSAMAAGFLATMPILLMAARTEEMLAAARIAAAERDAAARAAAEGVDPLGKTQPDLGRTQPDLGRTQPDLGKTQPDLGKTQPDLGKTQPDLGKTQPDPGRRPELGKTQDLGKTQPDVKTSPGTAPEAPSGGRQRGPKPTSQTDAEAKVRDARDKWWPKQVESSNKTGDWIRYNSKAGLEPEGNPGEPDYHPGRPADPDFNPDHLDELGAKMNEAGAARDRALRDVIEAEDNLQEAKKAVRRGEIPFSPEPSSPAPGGCPPNCGTSQVSPLASSGEQMLVGSAGVSGSFAP